MYTRERLISVLPNLIHGRYVRYSEPGDIHGDDDARNAAALSSVWIDDHYDDAVLARMSRMGNDIIIRQYSERCTDTH